MPLPKTASHSGRRAPATPADPGAVPVEILDEQGMPLLVMPVAQAVKHGLRFNKAVTALYAGDRLYVRRVPFGPVRRETRREILDLFVAPVPAGLAPEDIAAQAPAAVLGYEPTIRFAAELPPLESAPVRLSLFTARLAQDGEALGRGLLPLDADELTGLAAQAPEQFSSELLRVLEAGLLFRAGTPKND